MHERLQVTGSGSGSGMRAFYSYAHVYVLYMYADTNIFNIIIVHSIWSPDLVVCTFFL